MLLEEAENKWKILDVLWENQVILRKNCYLGRSISYHTCCHPIFCLRTYFYPHFYLFNFSFMNIFSFVFEQGQTFSLLYESFKLHVWDDIFIDTWTKAVPSVFPSQEVAIM